MYYLVRETKKNLPKYQKPIRHIHKKGNTIEEVKEYFTRWIKNCKFDDLLSKGKYSIYSGKWELIEELN